MNIESTEGKKLDHVQGEIELRNIKMIYPSRAEVTVIENMNLVVPAGKVTALVGASGSGKSTIVRNTLTSLKTYTKPEFIGGISRTIL